jgi:multicomponent Na+:H+ antiporter subunit C
MSAALIVLMGVLFASGTFLILQRSLTRIILGVGMLANGVNIVILGIGGRSGEAPIIGREGEFTDPVPQALILTAIVIGFGITAFLLALAWRGWTIDGNDDVEDDDEDQRVTSTKLVRDGTQVPGDFQ